MAAPQMPKHKMKIADPTILERLEITINLVISLGRFMAFIMLAKPDPNGIKNADTSNLTIRIGTASK